MLKEDDPELDADQGKAEDDYYSEFDESEFLKNAHELDLPDSEDENGEMEKDL